MTESPNQFVLLRASVPILNSLEDETIELNEKITLSPNPSFGESSLSFYVSKNQLVSVRIMGSNGNLIKEVASQNYAVGTHSIMIESDELRDGLYFIEIGKGDSKSFLKFVKM
jgi:hypothetical protein